MCCGSLWIGKFCGCVYLICLSWFGGLLFVVVLLFSVCVVSGFILLNSVVVGFI